MDWRQYILGNVLLEYRITGKVPRDYFFMTQKGADLLQVGELIGGRRSYELPWRDC